MPIVMVRHLCKGKIPLQLVGQVEPTAHARVLLQALEDAEDVREPEGPVVKRKEGLRTEMAHDGIAEVVQPVVVVGVAGQRVLGPVVV